MRRLDRLVVRAKSGIGLLASAFVFLFAIAAHAADNNRWNEPAAELARRIADVLGPASAHLTIQNLSSISNDSVPAIRRLLEDGLKADGVAITNGDSANLLRVTLSENARGGLWVAEVVQGNQTRVVMATVNEAPASIATTKQKVMLHIQPIAKASDLQSKTGSHSRSPYFKQGVDLPVNDSGMVRAGARRSRSNARSLTRPQRNRGSADRRKRF
jgi:hypothetical protein